MCILEKSVTRGTCVVRTNCVPVEENYVYNFDWCCYASSKLSTSCANCSFKFVCKMQVSMCLLQIQASKCTHTQLRFWVRKVTSIFVV